MALAPSVHSRKAMKASGRIVATSDGAPFAVICDDCLDWLADQDANTIYGVVTDPPYGLVEYSRLTPEVRDKLRLAPDAAQADVEALALGSPKVKELTDGKTVRKVIYVPGKLVSIVAN